MSHSRHYQHAILIERKRMDNSPNVTNGAATPRNNVFIEFRQLLFIQRVFSAGIIAGNTIIFIEILHKRRTGQYGNTSFERAISVWERIIPKYVFRRSEESHVNVCPRLHNLRTKYAMHLELRHIDNKLVEVSDRLQ